MTLSPDETRLLDLYRKAKRRRLTLHVVCMEAVAKFYLTKQEEAVTVAMVAVYEEEGRLAIERPEVAPGIFQRTKLVARRD